MQKFIEQKQKELLELAKTEDGLYLSEIYTTFLANTIEETIKANRVEPQVRQGAVQPMPEPNVLCDKFCIKCKHYEKIDDTEVQHEETFWETCHHPEINEMLCWNCEDTGCTKFEQK